MAVALPFRNWGLLIILNRVKYNIEIIMGGGCIIFREWSGCLSLPSSFKSSNKTGTLSNALGRSWTNSRPFLGTLDRFGTLWDAAARLGTLRNVSKLFWTPRNVLERSGTLWSAMESSRTFWSALKHLDTLWNALKRYVTLWNALQRFRRTLERFETSRTRA